MSDNKYKTVKEIAELLRVNPITIYGYIEEKQLTAIKLGRTYRIEWIEFLNFIKKHRTNNI